MIGNGAGGFAFGQGLAPPGTTSLASSDLNGDGSPDLVARGTGGLTVYANNGAGAFGAGVPVPLATGSARSILATDLTGDGIPDIAVADDSRNILSVHVGMGGLTYKEPVLYQAGSSPQTILPVDVDRDGGTDIVCLNYSTGAVSWFRNLAVRAPVIAAPDDVVGNESQSISFAVAANDPDGGTITSLTADLSTLPPGNAATFSASSGNQTGQFSWTPGFSDAGVYEVSFKAVSARVGTATTQITVANVDRAPVLGPVADQMVGEGETIDVDVSATDPDGQQVLIEISGPAFASIVSAVVTGGTTNGVLRLAPGITDAGTYPACEIRATAGVYSVVTQFAIIVANSEIEQPRITSVADVPLDQGGQVKVSWLASASDVTPGGRVDEYWVWRSTPSSVALAALAAKSAYVATAGATRPSPGGRMLQRSGSGDFYWEFLVAQP
ncbi:MAG: FG-GAP-like repeat-containing protein, partial [bacterium]